MNKFYKLLLTSLMIISLVACSSNKPEQPNELSAFASSLQELGDLNWNICTSATEMVVQESDKYTFFMMYNPKEQNTNGFNYGDALTKAFLANIDKDLQTLVNTILDANSGELSLMQVPVEPGYLNGFTAEIKDFKQAIMFAPMIGSIPFVGYVFER